MAEIRILITGRKAVLDKLSKLERRIDDWEPVLSKSANAYYSHVSRIFQTEGASVGTPWKALAPLSLKRRAKVRGLGGAEHPILNTYGQLRRAATTNAFTQAYGVTGAQHYRPKSLELIVVGDKVRNHKGFKNDRKGYNPVPARPFWPMRDQERDILYKPFVRWADDWLGGKGG